MDNNKVLFWDVDGVLTRNFNGTEAVSENLCAIFPQLSVETVMECYKKHCARLLIGDGTYDDVWPGFCECVGVQIPPDVRRDVIRRVPVNEEMFALIRTLRGKYRLGIITDNPVERMELIAADLGLAGLFDPIIVSGAERASKKDGTGKIFAAALRAAGATPEQAFFVDNQEINLPAARVMGIQTYYHDDKQNDVPAVISALKNFGVNA